MSFNHLFLVLFCLLCWSLPSVDAQDRRFHAGAIIGFNASQIQGDDYAGYNKIGLMAGLLAEVVFTDKTNLGIEIQYSQLGSRSQPNKTNTNVPFKITLDYMAIPVYYKYKDWYMEEDNYYKLHFFGGLSYSRLFGSEIDSDNIGFVDSQDCYKKDYLGILFGAIYYINEHWGIGARWERSLLFLYNNNDGCRDRNNNLVNHKSLYSKHLAFYATYSL